MLPTSDHLSDLRDRAILYGKTLKSQRQQLASPEFWYPYGSINNFDVLNALLTGQNRNIFRDAAPKRAADIGAADGDVSFFMERGRLGNDYYRQSSDELEWSAWGKAF
jgi:hypothetical protein